MPSHVQTCLDIPGVNLAGLGVRCSLTRNNAEWKINSVLRKQQCLFFHLLHQVSNCRLKFVFSQSDYRIRRSSISLEQNNILDFLHRDRYYEKIALCGANVVSLWLDVPRRTQTCLNSTRMTFVGMGVVRPHWK